MIVPVEENRSHFRSTRFFRGWTALLIVSSATNFRFPPSEFFSWSANFIAWHLKAEWGLLASPGLPFWMGPKSSFGRLTCCRSGNPGAPARHESRRSPCPREESALEKRVIGEISTATGDDAIVDDRPQRRRPKPQKGGFTPEHYERRCGRLAPHYDIERQFTMTVTNVGCDRLAEIRFKRYL